MTLNRPVVENCNGRLKSVFPFFGSVIEGTYVPKIISFTRICCSILNAFFGPLAVDNDFTEIVMSRVLHHNENTNTLADEIENVNRGNKC